MGILNRKKPEQAITTNFSELNRAGTPTSVSPSLKKSTSKWKKNKRQPEPKPEFNIAAALPSADDFRTSLIMPNLSARFSMLREQDDPNSLLGKASDDSVLQPRRRSRMIGGYGFQSRGTLGDIAEVSSIRSSVRPPFAESERQMSFHSEDGYDSDPNGNGSIMSRARPGEGNSLFGGRQKVYMIPKSGQNAAKGKAVYEDDIKMSAFQKHKQREREQAAARMADEARQFDFGLDDTYNDDDNTTTQHDSHQDLSHSPALSSYEKKRSTNSSSVPSEARSSTAATSIASQTHSGSQGQNVGSMQSRPSLERANTKGRRLYEQGLDQHIHEQQNSALSRLNSIQRQRGPLGTGRSASPYLQQTRSVTNLHDGPSQRSVYALGRQSPAFDRQPTPLTNLDSIRRMGSNGGSPITSGPASPLSPTGEFDPDSMLVQALEPGDRGKATAMGAFNKPKAAFDEKQYLERQLQLQRSASTAVLKKEPDTSPSIRDRSDSAASNGSNSIISSRTRESGRSFEGPASKNPNRRITSAQLLQMSPQMNAQYSNAHQTFFGNIAASDSEEDEEEQRVRDHFANHGDYQHSNTYNKWQPSVLPSVSEHPALRFQRSRDALLEVAEEDEQVNSPVSPLHPSEERGTELRMPSKDQSQHDSPVLPQRENLNGLVSHLRSKSNASSMYPGDEVPAAHDVPELPANARNLHAYGANNPLLRNGFSPELTSASTHVSNPWDLDDATNDYLNGRTSLTRSVSPIESVPMDNSFGSRIPTRTAAQRDFQGQSQISQVSALSSDPDPNSWQKELQSQSVRHQRDASDATQQERAAFDNELAARRAAIQDNIKSIVEVERSQSPVPSANPLKALGILRTKTSRDSIADGRRDGSSSSKPFKLFGASGANSPSTNSPTAGTQERTGFSFDTTRSRGNSTSRPAMPGQPRVLHSEQDASRRDWSEQRDARTHGRSPTTSSAGHGSRSRSTSVATNGRSRSRTGPYRDDLEKAMIEGTASSAAGLPDLTPFVPKELTPRPSPDIQQSNFEGGRQRSGSRTGYFDAKTHQPGQTAANGRNLSNGFVPQTLTSAVYSPVVPSNRPSPSPVTSPFVQQSSTPPMSGSSTPLNGGSTASANNSASRPLRKKTISKSDISEPTLISSTSNIDTVELPPGASLKNGMVEAPPVPPINPKRKTRKLFGKSSDAADEPIPVESRGRAKTPDPWASFEANAGPAGGRPHVAPAQLRNYENSPAVNQYGFDNENMAHRDGHMDRQASSGATIQGGMF